MIAYEVDRQQAEDKAEIRALALNLSNLLEKAQESGLIAVDIGKLKAAQVNLEDITINEGTLLRAEEVDTSGNFSIKRVTLGRPSPASEDAKKN